MIISIDHVQLAAPPGSEDALRRYYTDILGLEEIPKPPVLAARGGCWFQTPGGGVQLHLGVVTRPVYCTKIASKLARTYTDRHGLKDLVKELLNVDISKAQQSSDWGASQLTPEQVSYAASDVTSLHALRNKLDVMLAREGRSELAQACFDFLPDRAALDVAGWPDIDVFAHS